MQRSGGPPEAYGEMAPGGPWPEGHGSACKINALTLEYDPVSQKGSAADAQATVGRRLNLAHGLDARDGTRSEALRVKGSHSRRARWFTSRGVP